MGSLAPSRFDENPFFEKYKDEQGVYSYISDYLGRSQLDEGGTVTADQLHHLLAGFALVKKCIDDPNVKYNNYSFVNKAIENITKICGYLALPYIDWKTIDEYGNKPKYSNTFREFGVGFATAKAAGYLDPNNTSKYYLRNISWFTEIAWRKKLKVFMDVVYQGWEKNDFAVAHTASVIAVGRGTDVFSGRYAGSAFLNFIDLSDDLNMGYYTLLYEYLHDKNISSGYRLYADLKKAPGYGTQYRPTDMYSGHPYFWGEEEWRANNRWIRAWKRTDNPVDFHKTNGLDYMALYNLYNLMYKNTGYVGNIPTRAPGLNLKISTNRTINYDIHSYNDAELSARVTTVGDVTISASNRIVLKPGFSTNSNLHLKCTGPINACGDPLDQYGELLSEIPTDARCNGSGLSGARITNAVPQKAKVDESSVAQYRPPEIPNNYKSLSDYLFERKQMPNELSVDIYPNPVNSESYIRLFLYDAQNVDMNVFDMAGNLILKEYIRHKFEEGLSVVPLHNLAKLNQGIYIVKISSPQFNWSKKIVKN